jgi:hypothetical protein
MTRSDLSNLGATPEVTASSLDDSLAPKVRDGTHRVFTFVISGKERHDGFFTSIL